MSFRVVLVGPMYAGNVGACARVAANFNVRDLWIVAPQCRWQGGEAKLYAKGPAEAYLAKMQEAKTLAAALEGCTSAVGFTRRGGELRRAQTELEELRKLEERMGGTIALVLGREDGGLTRQELLLCTHVCALSTSETMPSMNLSHALAVVLYAACARTPKQATLGAVKAANLEELEVLFSHWRQTLVDVGITKAGNPDRILNHVRRALQRASLTSRDVGVFRAFLSKIQVVIGKKKRLKTIA